MPETPERKPRRLPVLDWIVGYRKEWLSLDIVAGLTARPWSFPRQWLMPRIAGLPVQVGLYTALVPMVIYAVLGTSRPLSVSTTTTIAILVGAELGQSHPTATPPDSSVLRRRWPFW